METFGPFLPKSLGFRRSYPSNCESRVNKDPLADGELGEREDRFAVVSQDKAVLGEIKLTHHIALSEDVHPGRISVARAVPGESNWQVLHKDRPFAVKSVTAKDPRIRIVEWLDTSEQLRIRLLPEHTYENQRILTDLVVSRDPDETLIVPLAVDIQETIVVRPRQVCFEPAARGSTLRHFITIVSDTRLDILKYDLDSTFASCRTVKNADLEKTLEVSVALDDSMPHGPFTTHLMLHCASMEKPIDIPIYGVVLGPESKLGAHQAQEVHSHPVEAPGATD